MVPNSMKLTINTDHTSYVDITDGKIRQEIILGRLELFSLLG